MFIKAILEHDNKEKFQQEVEKILKRELMKGWKAGIQSASKIILKKIENINDKNYKDKIADVKQFCEWSAKDDHTKSNNKGE